MIFISAILFTMTSKRRSRTRRHASDDGRRDTRQALLDAALDLLGEGKSFAGLSLREITRAVGIVPAAFYRHFRDVDELGLALVDESMSTLRRMIREAREAPVPTQDVIRRSVETLVRHIHANQRHFRFIAREMFGGRTALRERIRREIQAFTNELALDLGRLPVLNRWIAEDLQMIAGLMVNAMVLTAEAIVEAPPGQPAAEAAAIRIAEKQLRLISLGAPHWRSAAAGSAGR